MPKNDKILRQVKEFMVVGPDEQGLPNELAENPSIEAPGSAREKGEERTTTSVDDRFAGPQQWRLQWFGPFYNSSTIPKHCSAGIYLVYVGNYPIFVSSSANIPIAITRHLVFMGSKVVPIDLLGREILHYTQLYRQTLSIKTALIYQGESLIHPAEEIPCYRRASAALAFCHAIPCNKYARLKFDFDALELQNAGKFFPLKEKIFAQPSPNDEADEDDC